MGLFKQFKSQIRRRSFLLELKNKFFKTYNYTLYMKFIFFFQDILRNFFIKISSNFLYKIITFSLSYFLDKTCSNFSKLYFFFKFNYKLKFNLLNKKLLIKFVYINWIFDALSSLNYETYLSKNFIIKSSQYS
jgi:hypothetical protein